MTQRADDEGRAGLRLIDTLLVTGAAAAVLLLLGLALWTSWS